MDWLRSLDPPEVDLELYPTIAALLAAPEPART
jgi:hypothetical protein